MKPMNKNDAPRSKMGKMMDANGITIAELAVKTGLSLHTIIPMYYIRKDSNPRRKTIEKIMKALEAQYHELF